MVEECFCSIVRNSAGTMWCRFYFDFVRALGPSRISIPFLLPKLKPDLKSSINQSIRLSKMLEELLIFTRGGLILWSSCRALGAAALKGSPIDALIRSCLLEERSADASFSQDNYALKWTFHNELGLVFVAVYQRILHLLYVDDLLAVVRKEFSQIYDPKRTDYHDFTDIFRQLHLEAEARAEVMNKSKQPIASRHSQTLSNNKTAPKVRGGKSTAGGNKKGGSGKDEDSDRDPGSDQPATFKDQENSQPCVVVVKGQEDGGPKDSNGAFDVNKLQKLRNKKKTVPTENGTKKSTKPDTKKKVNRVWDDKPSNKKLDFTDPADKRGDEVTDQVLVDQGESMMDKDENVSSDSEEEEETQDGPKKKGWFSSMFQRYDSHRSLPS
jgi:signal recognition particle receptor subunit alpha